MGEHEAEGECPWEDGLFSVSHINYHSFITKGACSKNTHGRIYCRTVAVITAIDSERETLPVSVYEEDSSSSCDQSGFSFTTVVSGDRCLVW